MDINEKLLEVAVKIAGSDGYPAEVRTAAESYLICVFDHPDPTPVSKVVTFSQFLPMLKSRGTQKIVREVMQMPKYGFRDSDDALLLLKTGLDLVFHRGFGDSGYHEIVNRLFKLMADRLGYSCTWGTEK